MSVAIKLSAERAGPGEYHPNWKAGRGSVTPVTRRRLLHEPQFPNPNDE